MRTFLLIETDHQIAEGIRTRLQNHIRGAVIVLCGTEYEFVSCMGEYIKNPPTLVISEVVLDWTRPAPNMPECPSEVTAGGHRHAGFRCFRRFRELSALTNIPWIWYSDWGQDTLPFAEHFDLSTSYVERTGSVASFHAEVDRWLRERRL